MQNAVFALNPPKHHESDQTESLDESDLLLHLQNKFKTPDEIARRALNRREAQKILENIKTKAANKEKKPLIFEDIHLEEVIGDIPASDYPLIYF
jgi:hypothetical protein